MREVTQAVGERVNVLASFTNFKITIHFFSWQERTYKVDSMNLFHIARDGNRLIYNFAVSSGANSYQLTFDPVTLEWQLMEVVDA